MFTYSKYAKVLVEYSLEIKEGDLFLIQGSYIALPLIEEVYKQALLKGAHPYVKLSSESFDYIFYKYATDKQLDYLSPLPEYEMKNIDALLSIWANENTRNLTNIDPKKQARKRKAVFPVYKIFFERTAKKELRWCGTVFPTNALAQEANMSLYEYQEFVFNAAKMYADDPVKEWKKVSEKQEEIIKKISEFREFHIKSPYADLKFRLDETRRWINCDGKENFPDGEIFTGPLENSVEGEVYFTYPAIYGGREVSGVKLTFEKGKVVKASAEKNEEFLIAMLDTDKGARYVGEIAVGTNYDIRKFTKNILFDEKIGGTFHLAVGNSIKESGGQNESAIHWDMISDMTEGVITADGKIIYKNGKFII